MDENELLELLAILNGMLDIAIELRDEHGLEIANNIRRLEIRLHELKEKN